MGLVDRFEDAEYETEGDTGSESGGGPGSSCSLSKTTSGSEPASAGSPSAECASPTPYEATRLRNIERNNRRLVDLGLPALVVQVAGAEKAEKVERPLEAGGGFLSVQSREDLVRRVTRSQIVAGLTHAEVSFRHSLITEIQGLCNLSSILHALAIQSVVLISLFAN